jgi:UDP-N-acetylmuramoyl-L-alanyl-D-glutamate--2,6-diaminopimelate ligase
MLSELLDRVGLKINAANEAIRNSTFDSALNPRIDSVAIDSRKVKSGSLFLALNGQKENGFTHVHQAIAAGAVAVLYEGDFNNDAKKLRVLALAVASLRPYASPLIHEVLGNVGTQLFKVGITGTNGKTTSTTLAAALLSAAGHQVIRLGTIDYAFGNTLLPSPLTTPGSDVFFELLTSGREQGCTALAMEVSSHALSQDRVKGLLFQRVVFTNLTQDHLDFHRDFERYFAAKQRLFTSDYLAPDGIAILNLDSSYGIRLNLLLKKTHSGGVLTFSRETSGADVTLDSVTLKLSGSVLQVRYREESFQIRSALVGAINVENILAATTLGLSLGLSPTAIDQALSQVTVTGRNEVLPLPNGAIAIVDYAHTPDALARVLESLRPMTLGQLHCVFGCGGDRDKTKRPLMGEIAARLADKVVVTSDNPRGENPQSIMDEILAGMADTRMVTVLLDRRQAIVRALRDAGPQDCVLIAGKGHEEYQIIGDKKFHFSDQQEVKTFVAGIKAVG